MKIIQNLATFTREIVESSFARASDIGVRWDVRLRLSERHRHIYESIAEQTGASHRELAFRGNFNVIINLQWHVHAATFANQPRASRDLSDSRAGEQDIGTF